MLAADGKPKMPAENPLDEPLKIRKPTGKQLRSVPVMVPTPAPPPFWGKVSLILDSSYGSGRIPRMLYSPNPIQLFLEMHS